MKCTNLRCSVQWVLTIIYTHVTTTPNKTEETFMVLRFILVVACISAPPRPPFLSPHLLYFSISLNLHLSLSLSAGHGGKDIPKFIYPVTCGLVFHIHYFHLFLFYFVFGYYESGCYKYSCPSLFEDICVLVVKYIAVELLDHMLGRHLTL